MKPTAVVVLHLPPHPAELRPDRPAPGEGLVPLGLFLAPVRLGDLGARLDHPQAPQSVYLWTVLQQIAPFCSPRPQRVEVWVPQTQRPGWTIHNVTPVEMPCA